MRLDRYRDRNRLRLRLTEGTEDARIAEARRMLPLINGALQRVQNDRAGAQARFDTLRSAAGESGGDLPVSNPLLDGKSRQYRFWAPVILIVEIALASYTASLTIFGGWVLHVIAGTMATLLFCGLAKLGVNGQVDAERPMMSVKRLERQLRWVVMGSAILLGCFFIARFFPFFAEIAFAATSTMLSFAVAYLVALCFTLSDLLGAATKEVEKFTELALLERELIGLQELAEGLLTGGSGDISGRGPAAGARLAVVGLLLCCLLGPVRSAAAQGPRTLHLWIDVSGSVAPEELTRLRTLLADPLPLVEAFGADRIAVGLFAAEIDALTGPQHSFEVPRARLPACDGGERSIFTATRKAREAECRQATERAREAWRAEAAEALAPYREVLAGIDGTAHRPQSCVFPLLDRLAGAGAEEAHLVITDAGHARCGPPPSEPRGSTAPVAVILLPDHGGEGVAARLAERRAQLHQLFPGFTVIPSWEVQPGFFWSRITERTAGGNTDGR